MLPLRLPIKGQTIRFFNQRRFQIGFEIVGMQKRAESHVNKGLQRNELKIYRTVVTQIDMDSEDLR